MLRAGGGRSLDHVTPVVGDVKQRKWQQNCWNLWGKSAVTEHRLRSFIEQKHRKNGEENFGCGESSDMHPKRLFFLMCREIVKRPWIVFLGVLMSPYALGSKTPWRSFKAFARKCTFHTNSAHRQHGFVANLWPEVVTSSRDHCSSRDPASSIADTGRSSVRRLRSVLYGRARG